MKNKILLNQKGRNHIRIFPLYKDVCIPEDEADKIRWAQAKFEELENSSEAERLYIFKSVKKGYLVSVWQLNDLYYLVQSIRNEFSTYNSTIYITNEKNDMLAISKFLRENITTIMKDYKQQILDAGKYLAENRTDTSEVS